MSYLRIAAIGLGSAVTLSSQVLAADMPRGYPLPAPTYREPERSFDPGGWYLRGDLGYRWNRLGSVESTGGPANPIDNVLGRGGSVTAGVGIKTNWLRTDVTYDYGYPATYRGTVLTNNDVTAKIQSHTFLLNGYLDLGTWYHLTPYLGAGVGVANMRVAEYSSAVAPPFSGEARSQWNVAYAAMAGVAFAVSHNVQIDVGYRYMNSGNVSTASDAFGSMTFKNVAGHEIRAGLRWNFNDLYSIR